MDGRQSWRRLVFLLGDVSPSIGDKSIDYVCPVHSFQTSRAAFSAVCIGERHLTVYCRHGSQALYVPRRQRADKSHRCTPQISHSAQQPPHKGPINHIDVRLNYIRELTSNLFNAICSNLPGISGSRDLSNFFSDTNLVLSIFPFCTNKTVLFASLIFREENRVTRSCAVEWSIKTTILRPNTQTSLFAAI